MSKYFTAKHLLSMGLSLKDFVESTKEVESDVTGIIIIKFQAYPQAHWDGDKG